MARKPRCQPTAPAGLFVRESGDGPPIALVHGLASSSRYWQPLVPLLASRYRLVMPDLLGFGRSPKPAGSSYSAAVHCRWLDRAIASHVEGAVHLVGHSMGCLVALQYAIEHPERVRSLSLIALPVVGCLPWGHRDDGSMHAAHRFLAHTAGGQRLAGVLVRLAYPAAWLVAPRVQRDVPAGAARDAVRATPASYWRTLEQVVYGADVPAQLARLQVAPLLIHGERDRIAPPAAVQALADSGARLSLVLLQDAGHNPLVTHTEKLAGIIAAWIGSAEPAVAR